MAKAKKAKKATAKKLQATPAEPVEEVAEEVAEDVVEEAPTANADEVFSTPIRREQAQEAKAEEVKTDKATTEKKEKRRERDANADLLDAALKFHGVSREDLNANYENSGVKYISAGVRLYIDIKNAKGDSIDTAIKLYKPSMEPGYKAPEREPTLSAKRDALTPK